MIRKSYSNGQVLVARTAQMEKDAKKRHEESMTAHAENEEEIILHQEEANGKVLSEGFAVT